MGCCLSTEKTHKAKISQKNQSPCTPNPPLDSGKTHGGERNRDREPPPVEEEEEEIFSVKEVLSETPIPKTLSSSSASVPVEEEIHRVEPKPEPEPEAKREDESFETRSVMSRAEEASEASQFSVSQLSEINSGDTTAFRDEETESRSYGGAAKKRALSGNVSEGRKVRSPVVRRVEKSPEKRKHQPVVGFRRDPGKRAGNSPASRRKAKRESEEVSEALQHSVSQLSEINSVGTTASRDDEEAESHANDGVGRGRAARETASLPKVAKRRAFSGEISGELERRRVATPVVKKAAPSPEKRNLEAAKRQRSASPAGFRRDSGRISRRSMSPATRASSGTSGAAAAKVKTEGAAEEKVESGEEGVRKNEEGEELQVTKESLENPNVSLECFIFL